MRGSSHCVVRNERDAIGSSRDDHFCIGARRCGNEQSPNYQKARRCEIVEPLTAVAQYAHDHMALNILEIERAVSREN